MDAYAAEAALAGYNIRCDPPILTTFYQGVKVAENLRTAREYFKTKRAPAPLMPNERMGKWVKSNLKFIENAVGSPAAGLCAPVGRGRVQLHEAASPTLQRSEVTDKQALPSVPLKEDAGQHRADVARELVAKLIAAGTTYKQEGDKRDWNNQKLADCSKFVQWVLEGAGQEKLFGRARATTALMQETITQLTQEGQPFRLDSPQVGDIMMWGGHTGIVVELVPDPRGTFLVFAHMGSSGARLLGKSTNKRGQDIYWLRASDTTKIDEMGAGSFLGFWTPR